MSKDKTKASKSTGRKKPPLRLLLRFYDAWLRDPSVQKAAALLGVSPPTLNNWIATREEFKDVVAVANSRRGDQATFTGYIYQRLSPEAKELWDKLKFWNENDSSYDKIEAMLGGRDKRLRQELFIHALVSSNFDLSTACRIVSISKATLTHWRTNDLEFRQLVEEIEWHKKNFFERALLDLVEERHPAAVIFVNRTKNADRGYKEKVDIEHSGQIDTGVNIDELDLDIDTRKKILEAIRKKKLLEAPIEVKQLTQ